MLEIERAGVKDHGVVTALLLNFARTQGWTPEVDRDRWDRVVAELLDSDGWLFLVARLDGEPVALAAASFILALYGSREQVRLAALIVEESYRRQGIGSKLFEDVLASVKRRGCRELEVTVGPGEEALVEFYRRFGFAGERRLLTWPC